MLIVGVGCFLLSERVSYCCRVFCVIVLLNHKLTFSLTVGQNALTATRSTFTTPSTSTTSTSTSTQLTTTETNVCSHTIHLTNEQPATVAPISSSTPASKSVPVGGIVGGVIGAALVIAAAVGFTCYHVRTRRPQPTVGTEFYPETYQGDKRPDPEQGIEEIPSGVLETPEPLSANLRYP